MASLCGDVQGSVVGDLVPGGRHDVLVELHKLSENIGRPFFSRDMGARAAVLHL